MARKTKTRQKTNSGPKELAASAVGFPKFSAGRGGGRQAVFALSSHIRAREALDFALDISDHGFNVFVLGEDRTGRMTQTLAYLEAAMAKRSPPSDWVYLNNFRESNRPRPYALTAGQGCRLQARLVQMVALLREVLAKAFESEEYKAQIQSKSEELSQEVAQLFADMQKEAQSHGLDLVRTPDGNMVIAPLQHPEGTAPIVPAASLAERQESVRRHLTQRLAELAGVAGQRQAEFHEWKAGVDRDIAERAVAGVIDGIVKDFGGHAGLGRWFVELRADILDHIAIFTVPEVSPELPPDFEPPERRYACNLVADQRESDHPAVVLEANPSYENLFGRIEYRRQQGGLNTDFTLIRPGSLHRANGGVLVLRAEALANDPFAWNFLKGALRDRRIGIEELHRAGTMPIAGAPKPEPIPLDVKVVVVGNPRAYYAFFSIDAEFKTYFKVKADIDADMPADAGNLKVYAGLVRAMADTATPGGIRADAVSTLLGYAARLAQHRERLTARYELLEDVVQEAVSLEGRSKADPISRNCVLGALAARRHRNSRIEDRMHEGISTGQVMIATKGKSVGQVNGLVVRDLGDYAFGAPSRITARASVGRSGAINIERHVAMSGPIQQKGMMILQGWLAGRFAQAMPIAFDCSVTFEQNYGGVEGDSASLAELLAILSSLAQVPLRQDLAITGSVNQQGVAQVIGGATHKVEGFYRACRDQGRLTGRQGAVLPAANAVHLVLRDEVADAIKAGRFHIWPVDTIEDAVGLFTGLEAEAVYAKVAARLEEFDRILSERSQG